MRVRASAVLLGGCLAVLGLGTAAGRRAPDVGRASGRFDAGLLALAERQLALWEAPADVRADAVAALRAENPEWDLMWRTFSGLALANLAMAEPDLARRVLPALDTLLEETTGQIEEHGHGWFLLPHAEHGAWMRGDERSLFVDGELALLLGARRAVTDDGRWDALHDHQVDMVSRAMTSGPLLSAESYPDEDWLYCNSIGLAALAVYDAEVPDHPERPVHEALGEAWVTTARRRLVHPESGLLVSSWRHDGAWKDGPEGSSIWLAAHMLQVVDPNFAGEQYALARGQLGHSAAGLGWASEWPDSWQGSLDVDAGEIVSGLDASTSSSGLAIVAARAFGDAGWHAALLRSLELAGGPVVEQGQKRYRRSNLLGDAVVLYGMVEGPLWQAVEGS